ncbi:MAG TPA: NfeD family protein [Atribacterota bacterium]|nr:NfeD family protein [Atribacterota bacterium]
MFVHGETWQAATLNGIPVKKGEKVVVISLEGLRLIVKKTDKKEE